MSEDEREILRAARKRAMEVLSASSSEAERVADAAEADAVALLLKQQALAERVLREQEAAGDTSAADEDDPAEAHRNAAELLESAQDEVAAKLRRSTTNGGVDILMAGQREAAAILLDAWMRVTEGRPPAEERSD